MSDRKWAVQQMIDGKKVRHTNFTRNEYIYMLCGVVTTEDGYFFEDVFCDTDWMSDGWTEFVENESKPHQWNPEKP